KNGIGDTHEEDQVANPGPTFIRVLWFSCPACAGSLLVEFSKKGGDYAFDIEENSSFHSVRRWPDRGGIRRHAGSDYYRLSGCHHVGGQSSVVDVQQRRLVAGRRELASLLLRSRHFQPLLSENPAHVRRGISF